MFAVIFVSGSLEKPQKLEPAKISCHTVSSVYTEVALTLP